MTEPKSGIGWGRGLVCAVWALGAGCTSVTTQDLNGRDSGLVMPAVRLTFDLFEPQTESLFDLGKPGAFDAWSMEPSAEFQRVESRLLVEAEVANTWGDFTQGVPAGEFVRFGNQTFTGPANIDSDFDLTSSWIGIRGGGLFRGLFGLEGLVGAGVEYADIEARSGAQKARDRSVIIGPLIGIEASFRPFPGLKFYGRGTTTGGIGGEGDSGSQSAGEIGIEVRPSPMAGFFVAWRASEFRLDSGDNTSGDAILRLDGVVIGVLLNF